MGRPLTEEKDATELRLVEGGLEGGQPSPELVTHDAILPASSTEQQAHVHPTLVQHNDPKSHLNSRSHTPIARDFATSTPRILQKGARALFDPDLLVPSRPVNETHLTFKRCLINTIKYSWLNLLLVMIPVSWALEFSKAGDTAVFVTSGLAIVPCAALLSFATEELAMKMGDTLGGLVNCTFGNTVELIIAILALVKGELRVVQYAMIGSILSNCLLVLGCCFLAGGIKYHEQGYKIRSAQVNISMLGLSALAIVIPAAFQLAITNSGSAMEATPEQRDDIERAVQRDLLQLSHGVAIMLLVAYVFYLTFQLWTHAYLYKEPAAPLPNAAHVDRKPGSVAPIDSLHGGNNVFRLPTWSSSRSSASSTDSEAGGGPPEEERDEQIAQLTTKFGLLLILVSTVFAGVTSEWLVSSISGMTANNRVSEEWVALILLPLIGNASEHVVAVTVAYKNKLDLSIQVAVGSSIQIALFVFPLLVNLGWMIGQPLTLNLDPFVTITLFVAVLVVQFAIGDGITHWLEGVGLILVYIIIALSFWYYRSPLEL